MTNERTDHAAEDDIPWSDHGRLMTLPPDPHERIADALEALVEQQRIQNLIALHRHEVEYDLNQGRSLLFESGTEALRPDIAAALGIEDVQS
ncbi:hypothetical protein GCM10027033_24670 [Leucobacter ruminantium]